MCALSALFLFAQRPPCCWGFSTYYYERMEVDGPRGPSIRLSLGMFRDDKFHVAVGSEPPPPS